MKGMEKGANDRARVEMKQGKESLPADPSSDWEHVFQRMFNLFSTSSLPLPLPFLYLLYSIYIYTLYIYLLYFSYPEVSRGFYKVRGERAEGVGILFHQETDFLFTFSSL